MFIWDEKKNATNLVKHGIAFDAVHDFDWDGALILPDDRHNYGEDRQRAFGFLFGKLYAVIFTLRGEDIRLISLRRANKREERLYENLKEK